MEKRTSPGRAAVITMGCSKNRTDSEHLMRQLEGNGWQVVLLPDEVDLTLDEDLPFLDVLLINTCGFIQDAKMESVECILAALEAKKHGRIKKVFVFGCLSGRYPSELVQELPQVDGFFGVHDNLALLDTLGAHFIPELACERVLSTPSHYAYLKISEGCDRRCAYCAIPIIRGSHVSRPMAQLVDEASFLVSQGVKELILVAQDTSFYGLDLSNKRTLAPLMESLCRIDGLEWIRVLYTYPQGFPLDVLALMAQEKKICQYVDIPLQHVSDKVLAAMRRNTTEAQTRQLIEDFRTYVPGICLRTTFMVGHPGEDAKAFNQLMDFVRQAAFERMGAFMYSQEEGTYGAAHYDDTVTERTKRSRYNRLMALQQDISAAYNRSRVGTSCRVLVDYEATDPDTGQRYLMARSSKEAPEVDGQIIIPVSEDMLRAGIAIPKPGCFTQVHIDDADDYDLYAHLLN